LVLLPPTSLPEGVATVKPGTKLEFGVADGRRGPQALSVRIIDAPPSLVANSRASHDDLAAMIEDTIKILDKVSNGLRHSRYPTAVEAERLGKVLRGIAGQLDNQ
jgi:CspA family cold shock protein